MAEGEITQEYLPQIGSRLAVLNAKSDVIIQMLAKLIAATMELDENLVYQRWVQELTRKMDEELDGTRKDCCS